MSQKTINNKDEIYCQSIAKSIADIIRFSLDEEFRNSSFEMFGVVSTKETEFNINKKLMAMIENVDAKKRCKNIPKEKDENNKQVQNSFCQNEVAKSEEAGVSCMPDKLPRNTQKNWLEISSEQFKDVVKRRKLQFYSQPEFSHKDFELSNSSSKSSSSQPASSRSAVNETAGPEINYCRNKFRECFQNNV